MAQKKTVFLTGASGTMGWEGFKQLYAKKCFKIVVLLRDSEKNRKMFAPYMNDPSVKIVWGDLKNYESVLECVTGSDYVLHVGGMVSPAADPSDKTGRTRNYALVQEVAAEFTRMNGSIICRELLGLVPMGSRMNGPKESPEPSDRTAEYYRKRPCEELVGMSARIIGERIKGYLAVKKD